ncbi:helix-turn-helix domain-containing protein [Rhodococcus sp. IEGM 1318]|uniref:helix-turn-helix domain-containing protein n=1 Tax=Rhodococcus sp. IEGM 1318 TaxID=3082226 RepID=UPI0029547D1D|nr:helix-turn-helix domain-containing protein [Rhodococcus sp. IEGM 1318]MDV8003842.1 helix-turn-helix domain-containing protein [Rhodococcus sp. IEGM 1318]
MSTTPTKLISAAEAAKMLTVHPITIGRWVQSGKLTGYRISERVLRVDLAEIEALLVPTQVKS